MFDGIGEQLRKGRFKRLLSYEHEMSSMFIHYSFFSEGISISVQRIIEPKQKVAVLLVKEFRV